MKMTLKANPEDLANVKHVLNSDPQAKADFQADPAGFLSKHSIDVDPETAQALNASMAPRGGSVQPNAAFIIPHWDVHVDLG